MKACTVRLLAVVVGFTATASVAAAQDSHAARPEAAKPASTPPTSKPDTVTGVTVHAPPKIHTIPPAKRAAYDAEVAKRSAWTTYRATAPTPSGRKQHGAPVDTQNYPGLSKLGSH